MKILFAAAECAPFFKSGGLGDVVGALPKELVKQNQEVVVVLPLFKNLPEKYRKDLEHVLDFTVNVGWRKQYCGIERLVYQQVTYYFIDNLYYFDRDGIYGYYDDGERFAFFQQAVIEMMEKIGFIPDILHVHDYHTGMIPYLLKEKYSWIEAYRQIKTVLTIHNMEFQGQCSESVLHNLFGIGLERYYDGTIRIDDGINFLKAGIIYADRVNTVSPSYAKEIQTPEFGFGLDGILRMVSGKLSGILNGIDYDINNPETDPHLTVHFSAEDLSGKKTNKKMLQNMVNLPEKDVPLIGVVSRLTNQKGFQLVVEEFENLMQFDCQMILLGTGDTPFEDFFKYMGSKYPEKFSANILFDAAFAQKIYAGSDIFLMPSGFEPCGLSQMIAMRYGTLPVVHEVGGLKDTVIPYNPITSQGDGFGFSQFEGFYMMETLKLAMTTYTADKQAWEKMVQRAMAKNFSWEHSSKEYLSLYENLLK